VIVACAQCTTEFEARRATAKFCSSTCRSRANRAPAAAANASTKGKKPGSAASDFEAATRKELVRLNKLDSMLGQQALVVARRLANGAETGSAVATLSKEHSRLMGLLSGKAGAGDEIDEVARKRDEKATRARQTPR